MKPGGHLLSFGGSRTYHRMAVAIEDAGFEIRDQIMWVYGSGFPKSLNIGKAIDKLLGNEREVIEKNPNDREKRENQLSGYGLQGGVGKAEITKGNTEWEGWGTALKPAHEPIVLARKPLTEKTVAENILKYRTGGLNIDGCRVETTENWVRLKGKNEGLGGEYLKGKKEIPRYSNNKGRFPSNFIHDGSEEVVKQFPNTKSTSGFKGCKTSENSHEGYKRPSDKNWIDTERGFNDSGSASRFFYCAKASKTERNFGLENFEENKRKTPMAGRGQGGLKCRNCNKWKNSGSPCVCESPDFEEVKFESTPDKNHHPTVKPILLMRYLVRLITPPAGTVLDPFAGSGTTGIAAKLEGFNFIGIEKEKEYIEIAEARIKAHKIEEEQLKLI